MTHENGGVLMPTSVANGIRQMAGKAGIYPSKSMKDAAVEEIIEYLSGINSPILSKLQDAFDVYNLSRHGKPERLTLSHDMLRKLRSEASIHSQAITDELYESEMQTIFGVEISLVTGVMEFEI